MTEWCSLTGPSPDPISAPAHYTKGGIEPLDYIMANKMPFADGNVVKYVTRHRFKNGKQDVLKAIEYCRRILRDEYRTDLIIVEAQNDREDS